MLNRRVVASWLLTSCWILPAFQPAVAEPRAATSIPAASLMQPAELSAILRAGGPVPLVLQIGFRTLFDQAHIQGAEYVGPAGDAKGIRALRNRVVTLARGEPIVLYCGCCPWGHCPNVGDAYAELVRLGFTHVRVLYIAGDFGTDWVERGYPTIKGS